jgi:hypothetical protein
VGASWHLLCFLPITTFTAAACCAVRLQAVSDVFKVLSQENAALRRAAAGLAVQLLEEHGRASVNKAAEALQVGGHCLYLSVL